MGACLRSFENPFCLCIDLITRLHGFYACLCLSVAVKASRRVGQDVVTTTLAKVSRAERLKIGKPLPKAFEAITKQEDEAETVVVSIDKKEGAVANNDNDVVIVDKQEVQEPPTAQATTTTSVEEEEALIATQGIAGRRIKYWGDSPKGSFEEDVAPPSSQPKVMEEERLGASTFEARLAFFARMGPVKAAAAHEQHLLVPRRNNAVAVATEDMSVTKCGGNRGNLLMQDRCRSPVLDRAGSTITEANEVRLSISYHTTLLSHCFMPITHRLNGLACCGRHV